MATRRMSRSAAHGFTLIELMMVVAIIGLLASIAIPGFDQIMFKVRQSERKLTFSSIERNFIQRYGSEGKAPWNSAPGVCTNGWPGNPSVWTTIGPNRFSYNKAWVSANRNFGGAAWATIDWLPDGPVRYKYSIFGSGCGSYWTEHLMDTDGDGVDDRWLQRTWTLSGKDWMMTNDDCTFFSWVCSAF